MKVNTVHDALHATTLQQCVFTLLQLLGEACFPWLIDPAMQLICTTQHVPTNVEYDAADVILQAVEDIVAVA